MLCVVWGGRGLTADDQEGREGYFRRHDRLWESRENRGSRGDGPMGQEKRREIWNGQQCAGELRDCYTHPAESDTAESTSGKRQFVQRRGLRCRELAQLICGGGWGGWLGGF